MAVRIQTGEKNLAFKDQPAPLTAAEAKRRLKARPAKKTEAPTDIELSLFLSASGAPRVGQEVVKAGSGYGVQVRLENAKLGKHAFPPPSRLKSVKSLGGAGSGRRRKALTLDGLRPDHLDFRPTPRAVPRALRTPPFFRSVPTDDEGGNQATTIFPPDNRVVFHVVPVVLLRPRRQPERFR